jgi:hypothetical protein
LCGAILEEKAKVLVWVVGVVGASNKGRTLGLRKMKKYVTFSCNHSGKLGVVLGGGGSAFFQ